MTTPITKKAHKPTDRELTQDELASNFYALAWGLIGASTVENRCCPQCCPNFRNTMQVIDLP